MQNKLEPQYAKNTLWGIIALFLMSLIHHIYGETTIFGGSLRIIMSAIAIVPLLLSSASYFLYKKQKKPAYLWLMTGSGILFFFIVGAFEGFYAHTLLDILTLSGASADTLAQYWIRSEFKTMIFEITGVAQFPIALVLAYYIKKLFDETYSQASPFIKKRAKVALGWLSLLAILAARYTVAVSELSINDNNVLIEANTWTFAFGIPLAILALMLVHKSRNQAFRTTLFFITILYTLYFIVIQSGIAGESFKKLFFIDIMQHVVGIWTTFQAWQLMDEKLVGEG